MSETTQSILEELNTEYSRLNTAKTRIVSMLKSAGSTLANTSGSISDASLWIKEISPGLNSGVTILPIKKQVFPVGDTSYVDFSGTLTFDDVNYEYFYDTNDVRSAYALNILVIPTTSAIDPKNFRGVSLPIISWSGTGSTVANFTTRSKQDALLGITVSATNTVDGYGTGTLSITCSGNGTLAGTEFPDGNCYITGIVIVICNQSSNIK